MPTVGRRAVIVATVLASVVVALWVVGARPWTPSGPGADDDPGYGERSDWDRRWHFAMLSEAARRADTVPWWDPFSGYGEPAGTDPEYFGHHPAFRLAASTAGLHRGFDALYVTSLVMLLLGLAWLGRVLEVPIPLAMAGAAVLLCSAEWTMRLSSGHVMVLGICAWPAIFAAALTSADPDSEAGHRRRVLLGAVGGVALGLAVLTGAHYPVSFGLLAYALLVWARPAPTGLLAALVVLLCLPWLAPDGPAVGRYAIDLAAVGILVAGLVRGGVWRAQLASVAGLGLGLLGVAASVALPAMARAGEMGRGIVQFAGPTSEYVPVSSLLQPGDGSLEALLELPHPALWLAVLVGIGGLALRSVPLTAVCLAMVALAWTDGLQWRPEELISLSPGMGATQSEIRLQWVVLLTAPLGLACLAVAPLKRVLEGKLLPVLSIGAVLAAGWAVRELYHPEAGPRPELTFPADAGRVRGLGDGSIQTSFSTLNGLVTPFPGHSPPPPESASAAGLVWTSDRGAVAPLPASAEVHGSLTGWEILAPAGTTVVLAQLDAVGWRCDGGEIAPDEGTWEDGGPERWWLSVRVGPSERAVCVFRPPGVALGRFVQAVAVVVLFGLLAVEVRNRRSAEVEAP